MWQACGSWATSLKQRRTPRDAEDDILIVFSIHHIDIDTIIWCGTRVLEYSKHIDNIDRHDMFTVHLSFIDSVILANTELRLPGTIIDNMTSVFQVTSG